MMVGRSLRGLPNHVYNAHRYFFHPRGLYSAHRYFSKWNYQQLLSFSSISGTGVGKEPVRDANEELLKAQHEKHNHVWLFGPAHSNSPVSYFGGQRLKVVHRAWLRDACSCEKCVDPSSGQKRFATCDIPDDLPITGVLCGEDGSLEVTWENDFFTHDTHTSRYPLNIWGVDSLKFGSPVQKLRTWNRSQMTKLAPFYPYRAFIEGGPEYRQAIATLFQYGLLFLRDMPHSEQVVEEVAGKIGILQETFYGKTWDVISKPNAENVAYTSSYLGLHQDLLYMESVPRIQLLHCLKNTCGGGESLFSDGFHTSQQFRTRFPGMVRPLTDRKVLYHYRKSGNVYQRARAVLFNGYVFWSPPFQSPVQMADQRSDGIDEYAKWLKAARKMKELLEDDLNVYEHKLKPGECVIFDNRRVLHGRRGFDTSSGERWLKGAYVENSSYVSKLWSLNLRN
ncbi:Clavaminate synthase-like protein [Xylariaceae sp. FL1651]|nr:Clavaminate synthase-like protein [Xylariaceae sp. FL1651]